MKNILVITYWSYKDALIQTYTLPYVKLITKHLPAGSRIYLVTLEQERSRLTKEEKEKVSAALFSQGIIHIPLVYYPFGARAAFAWAGYMLKLLSTIITKKVSYIHAWCTPAGAIGYILSRLTGKPLVVDSYEPHAESMVENGTWSRNSKAFKLLFRLEKLQTKKAIALIGLTESMKNYAKEKYHVTPLRFYVKPACVDMELFRQPDASQRALLREELELKDKIVCIYAGKTGGIYLTNEIFDFYKAAYDHWGDRFRVIMLTDTPREKINELATASHFPPALLLSRFVSHAEVVKYLSIGDFAINPVKPVPSKRYCTSIKDGEYWALGLPVVITTGISDDSDIIEQNNAGSVIYSLSPDGYVAAIKKIDELLLEPQDQLRKRIRDLAYNYRSYERAEKIYQDIYGKS